MIKEIDQEATYKYLDVNEGNGTEDAKMKERNCMRRVRIIMKTELNSQKYNNDH